MKHDVYNIDNDIYVCPHGHRQQGFRGLRAVEQNEIPTGSAVGPVCMMCLRQLLWRECRTTSERSLPAGAQGAPSGFARNERWRQPTPRDQAQAILSAISGEASNHVPAKVERRIEAMVAELTSLFALLPEKWP